MNRYYISDAEGRVYDVEATDIPMALAVHKMKHDTEVTGVILNDEDDK